MLNISSNKRKITHLRRTKLRNINSMNSFSLEIIIFLAGISLNIQTDEVNEEEMKLNT